MLMLMLECSQSVGWPLFQHCEIPEFLRLCSSSRTILCYQH